MATTSDLDRLYSLLTAKTGITRTRDFRLEVIAADRALELRRGLGLTAEPGEEIQHDPEQLQARVYPWQLVDRVTENAAWHYYPPTWVDHIDAAVDATLPDGTKVGWWNSPIHRQQLENPDYTHWGHGIYFEDVVGESRRWYFITVFGVELEPLKTVGAFLPAGAAVGYHLTADGKTIHKQVRNLGAETPITVDAMVNSPGRGLMWHIATGTLRRRWVVVV